MDGYHPHFLVQLNDASMRYSGVAFPRAYKHHASGDSCTGSGEPQQVAAQNTRPTQQQAAQAVPDSVLAVLLDLVGSGRVVRVRAVTNDCTEIELAR